MAGAVIEAGRRAERGPEVEREFGDRNVLRRRERLVVQPVGLLCGRNTAPVSQVRITSRRKIN